MTTGFTTISGNRYFFNNSGVMLTGLQEIAGIKYYFYPEGNMAVSTTIVVGTKQYTVNENGIVTAEENLKINGATTGAQIVNFALKYVGNPYVYGEQASRTARTVPDLYRPYFRHSAFGCCV